MDASVREQLVTALDKVKEQSDKLDALSAQVTTLQTWMMVMPYFLCIEYNLGVPEGIRERIETCTGLTLPDPPA